VSVAERGQTRVYEGAPRVPNLLATTAAWAWRLIVVGATVYVLMNVIQRIAVVAIPCALALLLCALLHPLVDRFRGWGLPNLAATWAALLIAIGLLAGIGTVVVIRANAEFPTLVSELRTTASHIQNWLETGPLHMKKAQLQNEVDKGLKVLQDRQGELVNTALSATAKVAEFLAGFVLMLFVCFYLLKDGRSIWTWLIQGTGQYHSRINRAGMAGWRTLSDYVQGTVIVSAVHAIAVAITLTVMGVPLVAPLALIVFLASFIPLVGILFAGALALLVVLSAKGLVMGLIFLGILIAEQQLEGHLLQPLVVGRKLHFHPLGIIVVLAVGGVVGGIPGAALAVPITAVIYRAWPELRRPPEAELAEEPQDVPAEEPEEPEEPASEEISSAERAAR
jgi:predicted PurR-regulated permease PerM